MMRILIYEHLCATLEPSPSLAPLLAEGRAMLFSAAEDLALLPEVQVSIVLATESNLSPPTGIQIVPSVEWLCEARSAEGVLLIAPETDGILFSLAREIESLGIRLLGPSSVSIARFSPKDNFHRLAEEIGLAVPETIVLDPTENRQPEMRGWDQILLKPADGAGCLATRVVSGAQWTAVIEALVRDFPGRRWLAQAYCSGQPASVAVLASPECKPILLPAAGQRIIASPDPDGVGECLSYAGGNLPLEEGMTERAHRLVEAILRACPELRGYFGIDIILGPERDVILEVNPRLTTSYLGYRRLLGRVTMARGLLGQLREVPTRRRHVPIVW